MELRQVRAFLAVVEAGSITAAARRLRLTQPALSRRVKALEEELGVALLERGAHSVSPTPAGEQLCRDGARWVAMAEQIEERVRASGRGEVLRLAYAPSLAGGLLGAGLERFSQVHPRVRVELADCSSAEMKRGLADGRYDLILTVPEEGDGQGVSWRELKRIGWRLAVAAGHRLAGVGQVAAGELAGERWLMFGRDEYPEYWRQVVGYCRAQGLSPGVAGEFDGFSSLSTAVAGGLGVALVAEGSVVGDGSGLRLLELDPAPEPIVLAAGFAAGAEPDLPCQVLIEEIRRVGREAG